MHRCLQQCIDHLAVPNYSQAVQRPHPYCSPNFDLPSFMSLPTPCSTTFFLSLSLNWLSYPSCWGVLLPVPVQPSPYVLPSRWEARTLRELLSILIQRESAGWLGADSLCWGRCGWQRSCMGAVFWPRFMWHGLHGTGIWTSSWKNSVVVPAKPNGVVVIT